MRKILAIPGGWRSVCLKIGGWGEERGEEGGVLKRDPEFRILL